MKHKSGVIRHNWDTVKNESLTDLIDRKMVWGENLMLSHVYLKKGSIVPLHQHSNEQFSYILKGSMRFWLEREGGDEIEVRTGDVLLPRIERVDRQLDDPVGGLGAGGRQLPGRGGHRRDHVGGE